MRKLIFSSAGSPFARKVRIVLHEMGIEYAEDIRPGIRPVDEFKDLNPALSLPVFQDRDTVLFGSNLIIEYALASYCINLAQVDTPFAGRMTRAHRHWDDLKILTTIETFADTMVNVRQFQSEGMQRDSSAYLARQEARLNSCLDWLEQQATPEGFWPGMFSIMDIALISPLHYAETRNVIQWRVRPVLSALFEYWQDRASVKATAEPPFKMQKAS